jgi:tetratricopeptide (TPR) repeat protein
MAVALEPNHPATHLAEGYYAYYTIRDYDTALQYFSLVVAAEPLNSDAIAAISFLKRRTGEYEQAVPMLERALELNPDQDGWWFTLSQLNHCLRLYDEAESCIERAIELAPEFTRNYAEKALVQLTRDGDTERARQTLEAASAKFDAGTFVVRWTELYILDGDYQQALDLVETRPETAGNHLRMARLHGLLGATDKAKEHYETALAMTGTSRSHVPIMNRSLALAGLGRNREAIDAAREVVNALPVSQDALTGLVYAENLAWIYTQTGEHDRALDQLELLLSIPGPLSVPLMKIDPRWEALRGLERWGELVGR